MTTIQFRVKQSRGSLVEAKTIPSGGSQPDQRDGNLSTDNGVKIKWQAITGGPDKPVYTATFRNLDTNAAVWPFVETADGKGTAPAGYTGPLVLPFGPAGNQVSSVTLTTKGLGFPVKYTVAAEPSSKIDALDPMIIIRPLAMSSMNVTFGATCAVLGAVAGALLTTWLL